MLKGIPNILPPELLKILAEMGHGDELLIADGNYPAGCCPSRVVRCDGHGIPEILDAILSLMPLDPYVEYPVTLMDILPGDPVVPVIWDTYREIIDKYEPEEKKMEKINKFVFYDKAKTAYAAVTSSEGALYANIILKKGVIKPEQN